MRICIDSNQFIFGIAGTDPAAETLMLLLHLVSDNRHFLVKLAGAAFEVLTPEKFIQRYHEMPEE